MVNKVDTRIYMDAESTTQQSSKDECDINLIVERAKRGADLSKLERGTAMYGDFTGLPDYREALLLINQARDQFMQLDAFVRERFGNDPGRFVEFVKDPKNREEGVKLGIFKAPEKPKVDEHLETLKSIDRGLRESSGSKKAKAKAEDE